MESNKQKLKIMFADGITDKSCVNYLNVMFDVEVLNFTTDVDYENTPSLIVFTGGADVEPRKYEEKKGKYTNCDTQRDLVEGTVYLNFRGMVPFLGICRGAQLLTVMEGGALIQHTTGHRNCTHTISKSNGRAEEYTMSGDHHQMMYPFKLKSEFYEILYHSTYFNSDTYLNGDNEEIQLPSNFVEPEIVMYPNSRALAIQGHPEWMGEEHAAVKMTLNLINDKLLNSKLL